MRFGIIGTNTISDDFVAACRAAGATPTAVLSRSAETADAFADRHGLPHRFTDLGAFVACPDVDAVYVASPNAAHADQVRAALEAGKHVLGEKVLAPDRATAAALFDLARDRGVVLLEALRSLHDPALAAIRDALPRLGTLRLAHLAKAHYSSRYDAVRAGEHRNAFDPALANSAIADLGVYCLQPALYLFGEPEGISGHCVRLPSGFEACGSLMLSYPGAAVTCAWSKVSTGAGPSTIEGEDGTLVIDSISEPADVRLRRRGRPDEAIWHLPVPPTLPESMVHEVRAFVALAQAGDPGDAWREITLATLDLIEQAGRLS